MAGSFARGPLGWRAPSRGDVAPGDSRRAGLGLVLLLLLGPLAGLMLIWLSEDESVPLDVSLGISTSESSTLLRLASSMAKTSKLESLLESENSKSSVMVSRLGFGLSILLASALWLAWKLSSRDLILSTMSRVLFPLTSARKSWGSSGDTAGMA